MAAQENHQIPTNINVLRTAIGARKMLIHDHSFAPAIVSHSKGYEGASINQEGNNGDQRSAVQSELARLRFQVNHLREENALQRAELQAALGVFVGPEEAVSRGAELPLQLRVQAQQAELHDARQRAQQSAGVAAARQREMESLQQQMAGLQLQLRASQMETLSARTAADEASADQAETQRLLATSKEEAAGAATHAAAAEKNLSAESAKVKMCQSQLSKAQSQLREAEARVQAAETSRQAAEEETRHALPIWQEQLHRAEAQLRQLSNQASGHFHLGMPSSHLLFAALFRFLAPSAAPGLHG